MNLYEVALDLAVMAHEDQVDKNGSPYIEHPKRVAAAVQMQVGSPLDPAVIVALLHDVVEDSDFDLEGIQSIFGDRITQAVEVITHRKNEPLVDYYQRIKADPIALMVKFADIIDNSDPDRLASLDQETADRLSLKYRKATHALMG